MKTPKYFFCAAILLTLVSGSFAQGRGRGGGNHSAARPDFDRDDHSSVFSQNTSRPPGWDKGKKTGWDKGKKTGWDDCNVPPGQAKKSGCHSAFAHHSKSRHKSDRDDRDRDARARHANDRDHDADDHPHSTEKSRPRSPRDRR